MLKVLTLFFCSYLYLNLLDEQNPIIVNRLKQKIKEWLSKAEDMQSQIYPSLFEGDANPKADPQSNLGPRSRFDPHDKPRVGPTQPPLL